MDELNAPSESPAMTQKLIAEAGKASEAIDRQFLTRVVRRVFVHPDRLGVEISKRALRAALKGRVYTGNLSGESDQVSDDLFRLEVKARLRRRGGEMRLVVPPDSPGHEVPPPVSSLLKAVARGRQWYGWILNKEVASKRGIATRLGLTERYVGRVLECAFLAPDIVEAILDGRQPSDLTFQTLTNKLPLSWVEQRVVLGFPELRQKPISRIFH